MLAYAEKRRAAMDRIMKEEVYRNAVEIITNHGAQALTMERLARAIGVSRGTLYNYFSDRDGLLTYIDARAVEQVLSETAAILEGDGTAERKLTRVVTSVLRHLETTHPLLYALFKKEVAQGARREAQLEIGDRIIALLQAIIEEGIRSGEFRSLPLPTAAIAFFSVVDGHIEHMTDRQISRPVEETVSTLMEVIMPALRAR